MSKRKHPPQMVPNSHTEAIVPHNSDFLFHVLSQTILWSFDLGNVGLTDSSLVSFIENISPFTPTLPV